MKHSGIVHSFDQASGHGSIRPDNGGCDLGFESTDLSLVGMGAPKVGSRLSYRLSGKNGHASAVDVRRQLSIRSAPDTRAFTVFRSAAEEAATKVEQNNWENEGGHMSSTKGRIVRTPLAEHPYKVILTHEELAETERSFATMRECEAFVRRNTPLAFPSNTLRDQGPCAL
jgi:cold shock CspA family protein